MTDSTDAGSTDRASRGFKSQQRRRAEQSRWRSLALFLVMLAIIGAAWYLVYQRSRTATMPTDGYATRTLRAGDRSFTLLVADTADKRERGLGGRDALPRDYGMLFTYDKPADDRCYNMKNLNMGLDMIWLDGAKRVVHIERDVTPETYPDAYCPSASSQYFIELKAGQTDKAGIAVGNTLAVN